MQESEDEDVEALPPAYDKLKPPPPNLDDYQPGSVLKKQTSSKDAQVMIKYLQERNRQLTAQNERLRKDEETAAQPHDCQQCVEHERAAGKARRDYLRGPMRATL